MVWPKPVITTSSIVPSTVLFGLGGLSEAFAGLGGSAAGLGGSARVLGGFASGGSAKVSKFVRSYSGSERMSNGGNGLKP